MNFFGRKLNVYRAALHNHSTTSDGKLSPAELIDIYSKAGFDVFAFTDHSKTNPVSTFDGKGMTLISGMEMHPMGPRNIPWHLLTLGLPEDFEMTFTYGQESVDAAVAAGAIVFCAHPYWSGLRTDEIMELKGLTGVEVYNNSCRCVGREFDTIHWDELLEAGYHYPALAVDDIHTIEHFCGGWVNVLAENKEPETILTALKNGDFYSSTGPEIKSITFENNVLKAEFSPCVRAVVYTPRYFGYSDRRNYPHGVEPEEFTTLEHDFTDSPADHIRLQITDRNGKVAWSNPIYLKG
ncbi:MAG: CehA/McbA family metallohydrolase [Lentisphaeria bacterium]|nr:CehA/McbA family metallohydrolase [Lentisphaeria bacterium]